MPDGIDVQESRSPVIPLLAKWRGLMMRCESLGSGAKGGCQFGLVQRSTGAEPLGLLRWSDMPPNALERGLKAGFFGIGEAAQTELRIRPNGEYFLFDTNYRIATHTFVVGAADEAQLLRRHCERQAFLRSKFIDDLRSAEKIFVYKAPDDAAHVARVHKALCRFNPAATLLAVTLAGPEHPERVAGQATMVAPGLFTGSVAIFGTNKRDPDNWIALCRQVAERIGIQADADIAAQPVVTARG